VAHSESVERAIHQRMTDLGLTLATAESCTGGLIAHRITNVPGASDFFLGAVVAYSNEAKARLLGVDAEAIAAHGAVSEVVARQMAEGARARFGADVGIGVTGIAGPGGGTPEKPVGLVFICLAGKGKTIVARNEFSGSREEIKRRSAEKGLGMVRESLS